MARADAKWEKELDKISVEGTDQQKQIFYTALYHTFIQSNNYADVNGDYTAIDYTLHTSKSGFYSTFFLWDTYRTAHPLYTLIQPERNAAFVNSMISQYNTYGYLPIWQLWGQENYCMIGNHAIPVVVDAVLKGTPGIDINKAYEAVKNSSVTDHPDSPFKDWEKYHYMPKNVQSQSVSLTLEMAYDDWCVAQLAKKLNKTSDYRYLCNARKISETCMIPKPVFSGPGTAMGNGPRHLTLYNMVAMVATPIPKATPGSITGMYRRI